ncbi:hypothetical protein ACWEQL_10260 [Kitasatospora sp. NPDC004240]
MTVSERHHDPAAGDPLPGSPSAPLAWPGPDTVPAYSAGTGSWGPAGETLADATATLPVTDAHAEAFDAAYAEAGGWYPGADAPDVPAADAGPEEADTAPPVFVDSSGRRQRRVRRLGLVLAVPAAGYLVLLASTVLGGPTVSAPFLPLPQPAPSAPAPEAPAPLPGITGTAGPDSAQDEPAAPAATHRPDQAQAGAPSPAATTARPTQAGPPTAVPTPGNGNGNGNATPGHGRPTDPPGNSGNKPTKPTA